MLRCATIPVGGHIIVRMLRRLHLRWKMWYRREDNPMSEFIYLDHSATTPTDPRGVEAMLPYWTQTFGNPSSLHQAGKAAQNALERAQETIASVLNCQPSGPSEIVFTSGGTESDNLAIKGVAYAMRSR